MNTYCPVRPPKSFASSATWSTVKATKSTTLSNSRSPRTDRTEDSSRTSATSRSTPAGSGRLDSAPRFSTVTSAPRASASVTHAELIRPVPPMKSRRWRAHGLRSSRRTGIRRGAAFVSYSAKPGMRCFCRS